MADNVTVDTLSTDPVIATDDIAGVQYQRVKVVLGANGTNDGDISSANPLPISDAGGSVTVDGTVAISNSSIPVTDNDGSLTVDGTVAATQSGTWNVGTVSTVTNVVHVDDNASTLSVDDGGGSLTVDGTVAVSGSVAVTGTFYQVTQPVSIATSVPVTDNSGSLTVDAPVATPVFVRLSDGSSAITTLPVSVASVPSHAVTNAGTFATQVTSISAGDNNIGNVDVVTLPALAAGTNNIGDVDVLSLPALPAGSNNIGDVDVLTLPAVNFQDVAITGGVTTTSGNNVVLASPGTSTLDLLNGTAGNSFQTITLQITPAAGTVTAGAISFEGSNDGTNFFIVPLYDVTNPVAGSITTYSVVASTPRMFSGPVPARYFRARISTGITGTTTGVVCVTKLTTCPFISSQAYITVAPSSNNIGDVDVLTLPALPAGTNNIGDVDVLSIAAGSNLIGDVGLQGRTTGGLSIFRSIDLDESEEEVKGSAGTLYSIDAMNMTASVLYLKIYDNTAAGTTVGTTTPVLTYVLPTNGDTNGCGMVKNIPQGLAFATGISVAVTTALADNDTGAPAANAAIVNIGYK